MSGIRGSPDYLHMDINALLDVDLVAVEAEDHLSVLLELTAPGRDSGAQRPPSTLQVVLDRSGSMSDGRLDAAKDALESLIARLDPTDNFGLVTFDDDVEVPIPAGPLADKHAAREAIRSVWTGRDDQPLRRLPPRDSGGAPGRRRPWLHPPAALRWPRQRRRDRSRRARADRLRPPITTAARPRRSGSASTTTSR